MPVDGGDLRRYNARRDWGSQGDARRAMYDLCRDSGMTHAGAHKASEQGAQKFASGEGDGSAVRTGGAFSAVAATPGGRRSPFRVPFPWEAAPSPSGV